MQKFIVELKDNGKRLDKYLKEKLSNISRHQIQKKIKANNILVNDKKIAVHKFLKNGDKIKIIDSQPEEKKIKNIKFDKKWLVKETSDYLIINKPAGLLTHKTNYSKEQSLADVIVKKYPEISNVGEDLSRPGIVHRLDRQVSGLMVIARSQKMFKHLKKQFQQRKIFKKYKAVVYGKIEKDEDEINFPLTRSSVKRYKVAALPNNLLNIEKNLNIKKALTYFVVKKRFVNYSFLDVVIKTGRTHQIRAHLSAYNHPIVGDNIYTTKKYRNLNKKKKLYNILLYSAHLGFFDLKNNWNEFKIDEPKEMKNFFTIIKMRLTNKIFIISGPSGAGEDSVIKELKKIMPIEQVITTTTRQKRNGEKQGNPYYFVSKEKFKQGIKDNKFFEHTQHYNDQYYGVAKQELQRVEKIQKIKNKIVIWKVEYKGVIKIKKQMGKRIVAIFIAPPSMDTLKKRLQKRGDDEKIIEERSSYSKKFLKHQNNYDYIVVNKENKLNQTVAKIKHIIEGEC